MKEKLSPEELKEELSKVRTNRALVKVAGVCSFCGDEEKDSIQGDVMELLLTFGSKEKVKINFCHLHEGALMQRLLKSHVKRISCKPKRRDKKMGFIGNIPKDLPCEKEDGDLPSAQEKLQKEVIGVPV